MRLTFSPDLLTVAVNNDDAHNTADGEVGPGFGLIAMRERALSVGGRLHAGQRAAGGFEVVATLPLEPGPQQEKPAS